MKPVQVDFYYPATVQEEGYKALQAWFTALADGRPTRTWEYWLAYGKCGSGHRCLDTGAWRTFFCYALQERFEHVYASDSFTWAERDLGEKVQSPQEWIEEVGGRGVCASQGDIQRLGYRDGWFDCITCVSTLEHAEEDAKALSEMLRCARRVVVTTDIADWPRGYFNHGRVYSQETLAALIKEVTGRDAVFGPMPPRGEWMYPDDHTVCGFLIDQDDA